MIQIAWRMIWSSVFTDLAQSAGSGGVKTGRMAGRDRHLGGRSSGRPLVLALVALAGVSACGGGEGASADQTDGELAVEAADLAVDEVSTEEFELAENEAQPPREAPRAPVASAAAPVSSQELDTSNWVISPPFYAAGDEPYWRLDIQDGWFVFRRAGLPEIESPMVAPSRDGATDVFESPPLSIHLSPRACTTADGESGRVSASVWFDDVSFEGCAFEGQSAGTSAEVTAVVDSIQAVDSCLARLGDPAVVTGIYVRGNRQTALGMRTRDGRLFECVTDSGGFEVEFLDPVEPGAAGPWMTSGMRFLRAGQGVPACDTAEVVSVGNEVLGHMLDKSCRF